MGRCAACVCLCLCVRVCVYWGGGWKWAFVVDVQLEGRDYAPHAICRVEPLSLFNMVPIIRHEYYVFGVWCLSGCARAGLGWVELGWVELGWVGRIEKNG